MRVQDGWRVEAERQYQKRRARRRRELAKRWALRNLRRAGLAAVVALVAAAIALFLWKMPQQQLASWKARLDPKDLIQLENALRGTWAQVLGGALLFIGLYATWRRIEIAQEQQITERFTKAIEQLGSERLEIRLGAIYALERIASDSPRDHGPIMEILTAYVRDRAPWRVVPAGELSKPATDIQAVLTVVARRRHGRTERALDLRGTNLVMADLYGANLAGADLRSAHLEEANLRWSQLHEAKLDEAYLGKAELFGARLERADLNGAHLEQAVLSAAHLEDASLWDAHLQGAKLFQAHLEGARLGRAYLCGAELMSAYLDGTVFFETRLEGADLSDARGLVREQIRTASVDANTRLPGDVVEPDPSRCPECGGRIVGGDARLRCVQCSFVGTEQKSGQA